MLRIRLVTTATALLALNACELVADFSRDSSTSGGGISGNGGKTVAGTSGESGSSGTTSTGGINSIGATSSAGGASTSSGGTKSTAGTTSTAGASPAGGASTTAGGTTSTAGASTTAGGTTSTAGASTTAGRTASSGGTSSIGTAGTTHTGGTPGAGGTTNTTSTTPTTCTINSVIYPSGAPNPSNACSTCQPDLSTSAWVALSEGARCDNGKLCHQGSCQAGCVISTVYYAADTVKSGGGCWACKPSVSTTSWTTDGASCGCTGSLQIVSESTRLCVAKPVAIPGPTASTGYSIDATEVTRAQYAAWLATNPALPSSGDANCGWNTTFTPTASCLNDSTVCQGTACGNHPQVCADWCDAYAYCAGVGKRLCGKIGGGANAYTDDGNASASQWYNACASGSTGNTYPYGKTYSGTACNGGDAGNNTTTPVGNFAGCQAPSAYSSVYDLSGNVKEWEDSCDSVGQGASCRARGGSFYFDVDFGSAGGLVCSGASTGSNARNAAYGTIGFRCCAL